MKTQYSVYNPTDGSRALYDTREEAMIAFADLALAFALPFFHGLPFSLVETSDDGTQTWTSPSGDMLPDPNAPMIGAVQAHLSDAQAVVTEDYLHELEAKLSA